MAACGCSLPCFKSSPAKSISSFSSPHPPLHLRLTSVPSLPKSSSLHLDQTLPRPRHSRPPQAYAPGFVVVASADKAEPLRIMISGAPASGKGTQWTENGKRAKEYMEKGQLVPDEVVVMMVKDRLMQPDSQEKGWLLDGYPRSLSQATALKEYGFQPDLFILLEVHEEKLVERVIGRRLDPVTGKIYHLKYSPPETDEISARLTQRFDDTEEKVKLRLQTHNQNVDSVLEMYEDITFKVDGSVSKVEVFALIDDALAKVLEQKHSKLGPVAA
nr:adenylate kinase, chloroplastic [Ipomoea batatas]GMD80807.1 adenylate kinase, chloroplastic [Ipomoea batatas]